MCPPTGGGRRAPGQEYPIPLYICWRAATLPASANSSIPTAVCLFHLVLLFWYQVLTCVSVNPSLAASSILSCTERYILLALK